jgi:NTE family protein
MAGRALVLGSGGITGIAWELGMLAGLAEHGIDLRDADLVVGTSAGSVVGALITSGTDLEELYASQLAPPGREPPVRMGIATIVRWGWAVACSRGSQQVGVRVGRMALAVTLVDAVAASCSVPGVWPPTTIGGRRWIDGGVRSATNADLAAGYERVVVLAPITRSLRPAT